MAQLAYNLKVLTSSLWPFIFERLLVSVLIAAVTLFVHKPVVKLCYGVFDRVPLVSKNPVMKSFVNSGRRPLELFLVLVGFYIAAIWLVKPEFSFFPAYSALCLRVLRVGTIVLITLWIVRFITPETLSSGLLRKMGGAMGKTFCLFISRVLVFLVLAFSAVIIISELGYSVGGLITGIGLSGLTVALAAQDWASNIFGGLIILTDKPFKADDWIQIDQNTEGVVEDITFRSTRIRTFDNAELVVPNSQLVSKPITNWSRMKKRKVISDIGFTFGSPAGEIERFCGEISAFLAKDDLVDNEMISVTFNEIGDSALKVRVHYFLTLTDYPGYMKAKERVNYKIINKAQELHLEFAFNTITAHIKEDK